MLETTSENGLTCILSCYRSVNIFVSPRHIQQPKPFPEHLKKNTSRQIPNIWQPENGFWCSDLVIQPRETVNIALQPRCVGVINMKTRKLSMGEVEKR